MSDWSDIGAQLRATRNRSGASLNDVAHSTRIPVQTLHELEENNYSSFPSPAYAKSFLAQYSEHLGIDANEWLDVFETGNVLSNLDSYDYLKEKENAEIFGEDDKPKKRAKKKTTTRNPAQSLQPLVVFLVTACLVTGAVFGVIHLNQKLAENAEEPTEEAVAKEENLRPISNFPDARPARPKRSVVPAGFEESFVVATEQPAKLRPKTIEVPVTEAPAQPAPEVVPAAPPRAVIVEE
ncbi:MAG: hypothetical protein HKN82_10080 [Akkermansiaceae bacterium]|nr:hypothetical protein [Akkermansiaceae bacterium]NNM28747.1 hypothetical protein [Akkermansiaceae bacterium]